jgi:hypothetical protein
LCLLLACHFFSFRHQLECFSSYHDQPINEGIQHIQLLVFLEFFCLFLL